MTSAILRRNSSKQGLQNLIRLTAQWSVEDEEEAARERRRRERERQMRSQAEEGLGNTGPSSENEESVQGSQLDGKASGTSELEEDEGFSDWSQKLEQRKQRWAAEGVQEEQICPWREAQQEAAPAQWEERDCSPQPKSENLLRSPRHSYPEEESSLREAEVQLEQVHLDQEPDSPTIIQFACGPSRFLKFVPASPSFNQSEIEAKLEGQEKLSELVDVREDNQSVTQEAEHEEEEKEKQEKKRRRNEEEEAPGKRQRTPSTSCQEEECQPPLSPNIKITERTESLNRSIERSNSVKKTQAPLPVSKIDDKLEQYAQAVEDIVAGDIVGKRSLWEQKETPNADGSAKVKLPGKKYKYVATGHGQYKKVLIDDEATEK